MVQLVVLSLIASAIYFYVGFNAIRLNGKSVICKIFFILTLSLTIWSLAGSFVYLAQDTIEYSFWNKISSFGWCTFEAIGLYFVMALTENKLLRHWYVKLLILLPAGISLYMVLFLFGPNIDTSPIIENIFYKGNFLYNFIYPLLSIILILRWGMKSNSRIQKKQAYIIFISSVVSFLLTLVFQNILPAMGLINLPNMGQIFSLFMMFGVFYSINRFQFMSIPTSLITTKLFQELTGLAFLLDSQGFIIKVNRQIDHLLNYSEDEVIGKHISGIIKHPDIDKAIERSELIQSTIRFEEINISSKDGRTIPFKISVIPLQRKPDIQLGLLIIGEDISITKELFDEIEKRKLTNERLINSERIFRTLLEITPIPIVLSSRTGQMIYLNAQAQALFEADKTELIGRYMTDYFKKLDNPEEFLNNLMCRKEIKNKEVVISQRDNSELLGMLTMVPSIYQEEEVSLFCIIDITKQKKTEAMLKQNNEDINKLNSELVEMNKILLQKSNRDSLTNLFNHQYINKVLEKLLEQEGTKNTDICIMMIDIDYFKLVNDSYGHRAGDNVLVTVCNIIEKSIREVDYIGRYGGEEFLVVMPGIQLEAATTIAETIRSSIQAYDFGWKDLVVTISIGLAQYAGETANALINKADRLLYQAKSKGRNRYEIVLEDILSREAL
jgi:diguanylate cyclase (GGDEF)-like protein/PAS domain S-box-containing protein